MDTGVPGSPSVAHIGQKRRHGDAGWVAQPMNGGTNHGVGHDFVDNGRCRSGCTLSSGRIDAPDLDGGDGRVLVTVDGKEECTAGGNHGGDHGALALNGPAPTELGNRGTQTRSAAHGAVVAMSLEHAAVTCATDGVPDAIATTAGKWVDYGAWPHACRLKGFITHGTVVPSFLVAIDIA